MTLIYGFNEKGWGDKKKSKEKFNNLSEDDKNFYHSYLGMVLLAVSIDHISEETIPVIIARHKAYPVLLKEARKKLEDPEYLKRFIGFEANVNTTTKIEFVNKLGRMNQALDKDTLLNNVVIDEEFVRYVKNIYNRDMNKESPDSRKRFFSRQDIKGSVESFLHGRKLFDIVEIKNWKEQQEYLVIIKRKTPNQE